MSDLKSLKLSVGEVSESVTSLFDHFKLEKSLKLTLSFVFFRKIRDPIDLSTVTRVFI